MISNALAFGTALVKWHGLHLLADGHRRIMFSGRNGDFCAPSCSSRFPGRIGALSRNEKSSSSPMELWAGVSSPPEFEFGYQYVEKPLELEAIHSTASFNELEAAVQPYMSDVDIFEEEEPPANYVPPPPIAPEDAETIKRVEDVMYTLLDCIPGSMTGLLDDRDKWDTLLKLFSQAVEIQSPLICTRGVHSCKSLLEVLCKSGVTVDLHEIYYENVAADRFERWIYAIWTATLTNNLEETMRDSSLTRLCASAYVPPVEDIEFVDKTMDEDDQTPALRRDREKTLKLSGESRFEVNESGQVSSVVSRWYNMAGVDEIELATAKLWLSRLYSSGL